MHTDICGPHEVSPISVAQHIVTFFHCHSNWVVVCPITRNSEAVDLFPLFQRSAKRETGQNFWSVQSDRVGEYLSEGLKPHSAESAACCIQHGLTTAYIPEQNGVAEQMNRTLVTLIRSIL